MWSTRPVFISSTFLDMQAERDHLREWVFPALEEELKRQRLHLEWVDLRLGVATAGEEDAAAREAHVLKVCLAEVRRCRPFFLVLVGDRYGWRPPDERIRAAAMEEGVPSDPAGRSVTELEIEYGAFAEGSRAIAYFRNPLPYNDMPPDLAAKCREADPQNLARLAELKSRIAQKLPGRVEGYTLTWDKEAKRFSGLEAWGFMVFQDLLKALQDDAACAAPAPRTWQDEERVSLDAFIAERGRGFVGRRAILDQLTRHASANDGAWGVCVTGEAGAGKSALFAELHQKLSGGALVLAHAASASPRAASLDRMLRRWIGDLAQAARVPTPLNEDTSPEDVEPIFADLLTRVAAQRRVVLLIDALDQFELSVRARHMGWLPKNWPANARLIATAIPGEASRALAERGARDVPLPAMDRTEAAAIFDGVCARYHRTLEREVQHALLERASPRGPAYAQPLWTVLATEQLNLVDADDFEAARTKYSGRAGEKLRDFMIDKARALPPSALEIYAASFDHAEELFGPKLARAFVYLLALGRGGWRELDLRTLLPKLSGEKWDELRFASLRRVFRGQMAQTGVNAQWNCLHAQMRAAAKARLEAHRVDQPALHAFIADHLLALPVDDPLRQSEAMRHLLASANWQRAAAYFGAETLEGAELAGAVDAVADLVVAAPAGEKLTALDALLSAGDPKGEPADWVAARCIDAVRTRMETRVDVKKREAYIRTVIAAQTRLSQARPDDFDRLYNLSGGHYFLATVLTEMGERESAQAAYEEALEIATKLNQRAPNHLAALRQILVVHQRLGDLLMSMGRLAEVERMTRTSIAIGRQLVALTPSDEMVARELTLAQERLAAVLAAQGRSADALREQQEAVKRSRDAAAQSPDNVLQGEGEAMALAHEAQMLRGQGDIHAAERAIRGSVAAFERVLDKFPDETRIRANYGVALGLLGGCHTDMGDLSGAMRILLRAFDVHQNLIARDRNNTDWARNLVMVRWDMAKILLRQENGRAASEHVEAAIATIEPLARNDPNDLQWIRDLGNLYAMRGDVRQLAGDRQGAVASAEEALRLSERWAQRDAGSADAQYDVALRHSSLSFAYGKAGDVAKMQNAVRSQIAIMEKLVRLDPRNLTWRSHYETALQIWEQIKRLRPGDRFSLEKD